MGLCQRRYGVSKKTVAGSVYPKKAQSPRIVLERELSLPAKQLKHEVVAEHTRVGCPLEVDLSQFQTSKR